MKNYTKSFWPKRSFVKSIPALAEEGVVGLERLKDGCQHEGVDIWILKIFSIKKWKF
jgi:hypothetical protein